MFSMTTIELSTSIPMPSASPDNEIMFKEIFEKYIVLGDRNQTGVIKGIYDAKGRRC